MNSVAVGNQVDEDELEDELEQMQQEQLDEQMTKTGTVPVSDAVHKLPAAANGPRKSISISAIYAREYPKTKSTTLTACSVKGKAPAVEEDDEEEELRKLQAEMAM